MKFYFKFFSSIKKVWRFHTFCSPHRIYELYRICHLEVTNSIKFIYSVRTTKCVKSPNFFDATKEFEIKFHSSSQNI